MDRDTQGWFARYTRGYLPGHGTIAMSEQIIYEHAVRSVQQLLGSATPPGRQFPPLEKVLDARSEEGWALISIGYDSDGNAVTFAFRRPKSAGDGTFFPPSRAR